MLGEPFDRVRVRDAANEVRVADLREEGPIRRRRRGELRARERGLPDLHRVDAARLLGGAAEDEQAPIGEEAHAVADDRGRDLLADEVVGQERVQTIPPTVEDVEHVLAVGRLDRALELEAVDVLGEDLVLAAREHVPTREDDAVVLGQLPARESDRVDAHRGLGADVVDVVAKRLLAEGLHLEEQERAELRVVDLRVVHALVRIIDEVGEDALARLRVVLDLDREVAARRLDEDDVHDRDVRKAPRALVFARRPRPLEVVRARDHIVAVAARVDVRELARGIDAEAEDLDVAERRADLEDREKARVRDLKTPELGLTVVAEEVRELLHEAWFLEVRRVGRDGQLREVVRAVFRLIEAVHAEDVRDARVLPKSEEDLEAEQQLAAHVHDVARHAVVRRANALVRQHDELGAPERLLATCVERVELPAELFALIEQTPPDDLVAAPVEGSGVLSAFRRFAHRSAITCRRGRARPDRGARAAP